MNQTKDNKLVSIIVPVYRVEKYIERCISSILEQTYENIEVLVVDDRTPDNSIAIMYDIVKRYPQKAAKFKVLHHKENLGLSAARQTGIDACRGEYIFHLDSDDYLDPYAIELLVNEVLVKDYDIVIGGTKHVYLDKEITDLSAAVGWYTAKKQNYLEQIILQNIPNSIWGKLIKTSIYKENGIHCIKEISYAEDYAVLPKLLYYANAISFVREPIYYYTHYNMSSYTNRYKWKNITDCFRAESEIQNFLSKDPNYQDVLKVAHLKRFAWAVRQQVSSHHPLSDIYQYSCNIDCGWGQLSKMSFNHSLIIYLYKHRLMYILRSFILLSGMLVKKRKK